MECKNVGKSEITKISFELEISIQMFENDVMPFKIEPQIFTIKDTLQVELEENSSILVYITNARYFPIYNFEIKNLSYTDIRKKMYQEFDGEKVYNNSNELLRPRKQAFGMKETEEEKASAKEIHQKLTLHEDEIPHALDEDEIPF